MKSQEQFSMKSQEKMKLNEWSRTIIQEKKSKEIGKSRLNNRRCHLCRL